jgi:hypothetical protein
MRPALRLRLDAWAAASLAALGLLLPCAILAPSGAASRALVIVLGALGLAGALARRREPAPARADRDPGVHVLVAALALLIGILASHDVRLASDGIDHFVYLRSLWMDGDLDLANDYAAVSPRGASVDPPTPLGRTGNVHPVGPALLWSPFYALADLLCRAAGRPADGDGAPYRNAVALAGLIYGWLGLVFLYRSASPRAGRGPALLATLGVAFGTFLYWYLAYAPTMAHALAFAAAAAAVQVWLSPLPPGPRRAALLGAACGVAALAKWSSVLLLILPLVELGPRLLRRESRAPAARELGIVLAAALAVFIPQLIVWKLLYGSFLTIPQGAGFVSGLPQLSGVLFSPRHGLLSWSPILYLALPGLALLARREPLRAAAALALFAALTRVNAGVGDWWGGSAFGARRFDVTLPLFGLGLALALALAARLAQARPLLFPAALLAGAVAWNLLLAEQYRGGRWEYDAAVPFEEMGHGAVSLVDRALGSPFSLPGSLWTWWRTGRAPADYEALYMDRRHGRWTLRMGEGERLFLEDGWSAPGRCGEEPCRSILGDSAGLLVPLHRAIDSRFGLRLRAGSGQPQEPRLRVIVNQRPVGSVAATEAWGDAVLEVPAALLRPGRNLIRLRLLDGGRIEVAGAWLEPRGGEPGAAVVE